MDEREISNAHRYDDIIDAPHHVSSTRPQMPRADRAAQFAPFAALTGYGAAIDETARLTAKPMELDEDAKSILDGRFQLLQSFGKEQPEVDITFFQPDTRKAGGAFVTVHGMVRKVDDYQRTVTLSDGTIVPIEDVCAIEGDLFCEFSTE